MPSMPATGADLRDGLDRHFLAELRLRVLGAVLVVLPGDAREHLLQLRLVDAVLLGVRGREQRERRGRRHAGERAVVRRVRHDEARVARVLQLLDADRHHQVVGAAGDGVGRVADGLAAGGAHVLEPGDRLVRDLERLGEHEPGDAAAHRAEPVGVDLLGVDAGRLVGLLGGVDEQVLGSLVPVLAEGRAAHADDRDAVLDAVAGHDVLLRAGSRPASRL